MADRLPAALLCPIDGCDTLTALGTVDTMCQRHWSMLESRTVWRIYDAVPGSVLRQYQKNAIDEVNKKLRADA